jgi:hypothetical protein
MDARAVLGIALSYHKNRSGNQQTLKKEECPLLASGLITKTGSGNYATIETRDRAAIFLLIPQS